MFYVVSLNSNLTINKSINKTKWKVKQMILEFIYSQKNLTLHKQKQHHILDSRHQDAHREGLVSPSVKIKCKVVKIYIQQNQIAFNID